MNVGGQKESGMKGGREGGRERGREKGRGRELERNKENNLETKYKSLSSWDSISSSQANFVHTMTCHYVHIPPIVQHNQHCCVDMNFGGEVMIIVICRCSFPQGSLLTQ